VLVAIAWDSANAAPPGVTFAQVRLLLVLDGLGTVPCSRLASAMGVTASSVTRLADKLEARGFLARGTDEHKRSIVTVSVTERGRAVVADVLDRRHGALETLLSRLPSARRKAAGVLAGELVGAAAGVVSVGGPL
jgi:DNA-binding MarR family transcriptional regulator